MGQNISQPKNVLRVVVFSYGLLEQGGGFEEHVIEMTRALMEASPHISFTVVTADYARVAKLQTVLSVYRARSHKLKDVLRESTASIFERLGPVQYIHYRDLSDLAEIINTHDVLYTKNEVLELAILWRIRSKIRIPVATGIHTAIFYPYTTNVQDRVHNLVYMSWLYKYLMRSVVAIKVNNEEDERLVKSQFADKLLHKIPPFIERATKAPLRQSSDGELRVLYAGRLVAEKGLEELIEILRAASQSRQFAFRFKVAGSGDAALGHRMHRLAEELDNVEYLGHVPYERMVTLYDWTDVTISPSYYETLNRVLMETAIAGKVPVSSDIPGPREFIHDGHNGFLLPIDSAAFTAKLIELAELKSLDRQRFNAIGDRARESVLGKYSAERVSKQLLKFYSEAAQKPPISSGKA